MNDSDLFESMSPARAYFRLSLPLVLGMTVTLIYNLADTYFVAGTGQCLLLLRNPCGRRCCRSPHAPCRETDGPASRGRGGDV